VHLWWGGLSVRYYAAGLYLASSELNSICFSGAECNHGKRSPSVILGCDFDGGRLPRGGQFEYDTGDGMFCALWRLVLLWPDRVNDCSGARCGDCRGVLYVWGKALMPLRDMSRQPVAIITGRVPIVVGQTPAPVVPEVTPTQPVPATPVTCPDGYSVLGTGCIPNQVASLPTAPAPVIVTSTAGASALAVAAPAVSSPCTFALFGDTSCIGPFGSTTALVLGVALAALFFLFGVKH
jgi:hypothetical protein